MFENSPIFLITCGDSQLTNLTMACVMGDGMGMHEITSLYQYQTF